MKLELFILLICILVVSVVAKDLNAEEQRNKKLRRRRLQGGSDGADNGGDGDSGGDNGSDGADGGSGGDNGSDGADGGSGGDNGSDGADGGGGGNCFSGVNTVEVQGKGLISMSALEIGDYVRAGGNKFSRVYGFSHMESEVKVDYLQLISKDSKAPIELTAEHMVFVSNNAVPASQVKVGDMLGDHVVSEIKSVSRRGAYAPITESGDIVVSGVLASSYVAILEYSAVNQHVATHAVMAPFRMGLIKNWSYGDGRSEFITLAIYSINGLKKMSAPVQVAISVIATLPFFAFALLESMAQYYPLMINLIVFGFFLYKKKKSSKVKSL